MSLPALPYVPPPYENELLTSWLERTALFYGLDFAHVRMPLRPQVDLRHGEVHDADADDLLRSRAREWTGIPADRVPKTLDPDDPDTLDVAARLAYCPQCWNDDVYAGRAPYVRRAWAQWPVVHCRVHRTWLTARRPRTSRECPLLGWADVWRSHRRWADAHGLRFDPLREPSARAFEPATLRAPRRWTEFDAALAGLAGTRVRSAAEAWFDVSVLDAVARPENVCCRNRVLAAMARGGASTSRYCDWDLLNYRAERPGWLALRIACVAAAINIARRAGGERPLFPGVPVHAQSFGIALGHEPPMRKCYSLSALRCTSRVGVRPSAQVRRRAP